MELSRPGMTEPRQVEPDTTPFAQRTMFQRGAELLNDLGRTWISAADFYRQLDPSGRELTQRELVAARDRLEEGAACLRRVQREHAALECFVTRQSTPIELRSTITVLRVLQRSMVLATSDEPSRREKAISVRDVTALIRPIYEYWMQL